MKFKIMKSNLAGLVLVLLLAFSTRINCDDGKEANLENAIENELNDFSSNVGGRETSTLTSDIKETLETVDLDNNTTASSDLFNPINVNEIISDEKNTTTTTTAAETETTTVSTTSASEDSTTEETTTEESTTEQTEATSEETTTESTSTETTETSTEETTSAEETSTEETTTTENTTTEETTTEETTTAEDDEVSSTEQTPTEEDASSSTSQTETVISNMAKNLEKNIEDASTNTNDVSSFINRDFKVTIEPSESTEYDVRTILSQYDNYEILMKVSQEKPSERPFSLKRGCPIVVNEEETNDPASLEGKCIDSFIQVHKSKFRLIVKRWLLQAPMVFSFRVVISGCSPQMPNTLVYDIKDANNQTTKTFVREIKMKSSSQLPSIYHNTEAECIYRVRNTESDQYMALASFVLPEKSECTLVAKLSSAEKESNLDGKTRISFKTAESTQAFSHGVFDASPYLLFRAKSCRQNLKPILIRLRSIKKTYKLIELDGTKTKETLNSAELMRGKDQSNMAVEIVSADSRDVIKLSLISYAPQDRSSCDPTRLSSILSIYGFDAYGQMKMMQYDCRNFTGFDYEQMTFRGYKTVFVQFYRMAGKTIDEFKLAVEYQVIQKQREVLTTPNVIISSDSLPAKLLSDSQIDYEIQAPAEHRIVLTVHKYSHGQQLIDFDCVKGDFGRIPSCYLDCTDKAYAQIKLDVDHTPFDESSFVPKIPIEDIKSCDITIKPQSFYSFSNKMGISFLFAEENKKPQALGFTKPQFNFSFKFERICNNNYQKSRHGHLLFDSSKSTPIGAGVVEGETSCENMISAPMKHRVVVYKTDWLGNPSELQDQETDFRRIGESLCRDSDYLRISDNNPKYTDGNWNTEVYCGANPLEAYSSKGRSLFLNYVTRFGRSPTSLRFVAEMGYFTYRYLYTEPSGEFSVNFRDIVPANVNENATLSSIQFKIELSSERYLIPVIKSCNTILERGGDAQIFYNNQGYSFKRACLGQETILGGTGASQMTFEFTNVNLKELHDKQIGFAVEYKSRPRVLKSAEGGSFFTPDLVGLKPFNKKEEHIKYEWQISLPSKCYTRLNVGDLTLKKQDEVEIYDVQSNPSRLISLKASDQQTSFLFALDKLSIRLNGDFARLAASRLNISYTCEPRVIVLDEMKTDGELVLDKTNVPGNLEWTIIAPKNYLIEVKIIDKTPAADSSDKFDQLKFSLLGTGYSSLGYYHYNLRPGVTKPEDRQTDLIVSKDNMLRVEFLPVVSTASFKLVYSMIPRVLTNSVGVIRQRFNNQVEPAVPVPRPTDQTWIVRAPYGKQILINKYMVDLANEETCSIAKVTITEANGDEIETLCGNFVATEVNQPSSMIRSKSNEIKIRFTTQDVLPASFNDEDGQKRPYNGFELGYSFVESAGDCYFQSMETPMCGYSNEIVDKSKADWKLVSQSSGHSASAKKLPDIFRKQFNVDSLLTAKIESGLKEPVVSVFKSPVIGRSKRFLRFEYSLEGPELDESGGEPSYQFEVRVVRPMAKNGKSREATLKMLEDSTIVSMNLTKTHKPLGQLRSIAIPLGKHIFSDFQLAFVLTKPGSAPLSKPVVAKLDSIQLLEHDIDCKSADDESRFEMGEQSDLLVCDSQNSYEILSERSSSSGAAAPSQDEIDVNSNCQRFVPSCESDNCSAKGTETCVNSADGQLGYVCKCRLGYKGKFCEEKIDPCKSKELNNCAAGSTCVSDLSDDEPSVFMNYACQCGENQRGRFCEEVLAPCKNMSNANACNQLKGQGKCVDKATEEEPDKFVCECAPTFSGKNCEKVSNSDKTSCSAADDICRREDEAATCEDSPNGPVCICSPGFEGDRCQTNIDDCPAQNPCHNNGKCVDGVNKFTCECQDGYTGVFCEIPEICAKCDPTGTFYCESGANTTTSDDDDETSPIEFLTPRCVCHATHVGKLCDRLVDPCAREGICGKGVCVSNKTSEAFECRCPEGFKGPKCDQKETPCDLGVCLNGATCQMSRDGAKFTCQCPKGFEGLNCERPEDKCKKNPCQNGGDCYNQVKTTRGYVCDCPLGFSGVHCEKAVDNCANKCPNGVRCVNLPPNDYKCECPKGKYGRNCEFTVDLCMDNKCSSGACRPLPIETVQFDQFGNALGPESNGNRPYTCKCFDGFEGPLCNKERDHCRLNPCVNGTCVNLMTGYECICPQNQTGVKCAQSNLYCSDELMQCNKMNTRYCENYNGGSICHCNRGFTGARCETPLHICELDMPCISGTCIRNPNKPEDVNDYMCVGCKEGYEGRNCSEMIDFCKKENPCQNGADCFPKMNGYFCKCSDKFSGQNCTEPAQCQLNNCQNNSTCQAKKDGGYVCLCDEGYQGRFCEEKISKCKNKCVVGECDPVSGECKCSKDYSFCPEKFKCPNHECKNGGMCVEMISDNSTFLLAPKCICQPGFTGESCEKTIHCMSLVESCGPNAKACHIVEGGYQCECREKFFGARCNETAQELTEKLLSETKKKMEANDRYKCSFGISKESKLFLGITGVALFIVAAVGALVGHWTIVSYKKKYTKLSKVMSVSTHSLMNSMGYDPSSQMSHSISRMTNASSMRSPGSNSSHSFLIPRPNILPTPKP